MNNGLQGFHIFLLQLQLHYLVFVQDGLLFHGDAMIQHPEDRAFPAVFRGKPVRSQNPRHEFPPVQHGRPMVPVPDLRGGVPVNGLRDHRPLYMHGLYNNHMIQATGSGRQFRLTAERKWAII